MTINKQFKDYKLSKDILKALELMGYEAPTPVQQETINPILQGQDLIVKSKTGSGKTASFAIPICEQVDWEENKPQALVLTPTRELAIQIQEGFFNIGRYKRIKTVALYGKAPFMQQQKAIKQKTHIVVGTPGRVIDHLEKNTWQTDCIKYLVIDEADEMLRMGFVEQLQEIINYLPQKRVTLLFSATLPKDIEVLCDKYMSKPKTITIESEYKTTDQVEQVRLNVKEDEKLDVLHQLMVVEKPESCMIFCNTKDQVDKVYDDLRSLTYRCQKIHGGMEQKDRLEVMEDFRAGKFRFLIATDVAARGIDVSHVTHVVNYDIPEDRESYVHRIGRTGRASSTGKAMTFVTPRDSIYLKNIETYIGKKIDQGQIPTTEEVALKKEAFYETMSTAIEVEDTKLNDGIIKLHINAGKKTKMRPVDIVGTLCNLKGMTANDIGIINVLDVSTFVEILNNKGESVLKQLQNTPIKGRLRRVTVADR